MSWHLQNQQTSQHVLGKIKSEIPYTYSSCSFFEVPIFLIIDSILYIYIDINI